MQARRYATSAPHPIRRSRGATSWLAASMIIAPLCLALLAYFDAQRESATALADFAADQSTFAQAIALTLGAGIYGDVTQTDMLRSLHGIERKGTTIVLLTREAGGTWMRTDGTTLNMPMLPHTYDARTNWVRLSRPQSRLLGLPERTSIAGIAQLHRGPRGPWLIAVVTTAQRERDREIRSQRALVLGVFLAGGLVLAFGGIALRTQRKELELAAALTVAEVARQRDARLVRADKLATLGALATGIAHEISTPLGVIVGRAEQLLPKLEQDERSQRSIHAILEQGERISRVIRGFLALARGDSPPFEDTEPESIAAQSVDLVEHRFAKAGVHLNVEVEGGLHRIACEPRLLEQALVNLLLNACDACERDGRVTLHVTGDLARIAFVVTDNGVGIAPKSLASIVEPFFTTKEPGEGTGLGLAIANEIVHHHRGTLTIVSPPTDGARGTRACIEIPTAESAS